jgi:hypothetical protein
MTRANLERGLRAFASRKPFRPFLIEFFTGERLQISHPEAMRFNGDLLVHVAPGILYRVFDSTSVSQLLDVPPTGA